MPSRPSLGPGSGVIPGPTFFSEYQPAMKGLFDAASFPLTAIGGTANDVTASLAWTLDGGVLVDGMKFTLTWAATNAGPMTLAINGGSAVNILDAEGGAMIPGAAQSGTRALLEFVGGAFRVLSGGGAGADTQRYFWQFTASGTWTKPAGLSDDTMVTVEMWGGGQSGERQSGGAGNGRGGAGGGYITGYFRAADLPSSVAVTVGAGGAARTTNGTGLAGGTTSFGSLLSVTGGSNNVGGGRILGSEQTVYGGADSPEVGAFPGLPAIWGGASGGSRGTTHAGGISIHGGNGGASGGSSGVAGSAPGGGGGAAQGTSGAGARGEVRIWI